MDSKWGPLGQGKIRGEGAGGGGGGLRVHSPGPHPLKRAPLTVALADLRRGWLSKCGGQYFLMYALVWGFRNRLLGHCVSQATGGGGIASNR